MMLLWIWLACAGGKGDTAADSVPPTSPCGDTSWGNIDPLTAIHVRSGASGGDGSVDAPVATLADALALARDTGLRAIFVGPGTFDAQLSLTATDTGLSIGGCGAETIVVPTEQEFDENEYIFTVAGAEDVSDEFWIERLTLQGGDTPVRVWQGATLHVSEVTLENPRRCGFLDDGDDTLLRMEDVVIEEPVVMTSTDHEVGYGVVVRDASLEVENVQINSATGVALLATGAQSTGQSITITNLYINTVAAETGDLFGRGVQIDNVTELYMTGGEINGTYDAAIYARRPGLLSINGVQITDIAAGAIPNSTEPTGDGILVTGFDEANDNPEPGGVVVDIANTMISGPARLGMLLERVSGTVTDNSITGGVGGVVSQDGSEVSGDPVEEAAAGTWLRNPDLLSLDIDVSAE